MTRTPWTKSKLERFIYISLAIIIVLRFYGAYQEMKIRRSAVMEPRPAPDFVWRDFDGERHHFTDLKGKVVILHFWASWCGPCREELPALLLAAELLKDDAVFLTISGDDDDRPARKFILSAKSAARAAPENVLYGIDPMKTIVFDVFQSAALPESYIIDPQLKMQRKFVGAQKWDDPKLLNYIRELNHPLAEKTSAAPASKIPVP